MPMRAFLKGGLACLAVLTAAAPALAGDYWGWRGETTDVPWYVQEPWAGTGPGLYYSQHPDHVPGYPRPLTGYAVPIFDTGRPVVYGDGISALEAHIEWCLAHYRTYDIGTDTYQPFHGPRRECRSPY